MMQQILATLNKLGALHDDELSAIGELSLIAKTVTLKKGEYLFEWGQVPDVSVYVAKGLLRHYIVDEAGNEKVIQFHEEEAFFDDCGSFGSNTPIAYAVQAIEDCEIFLLNLNEFHALAERMPSLEKISNRIARLYLAKHHEHLTLLLKYSPEERYKYLLDNKPGLIQRVSVTHLAQYLGMSRETLSRMRSKALQGVIL